MISRSPLLWTLLGLALVAADCSVQHTVVAGDTCYALWTQYGLNSTEFFKINPGLSSSSCSLLIGQAVCVREVEDSGSCTSYGAVASGDNCYSLISKFNPSLSFSQLLALNIQINPGCTNLVPGQFLCFQGSLVQTSISTSRSTVQTSSTPSSPLSSTKVLSPTIPTPATSSSSVVLSTTNASSKSPALSSSPSVISSSSTKALTQSTSSSSVPTPKDFSSTMISSALSSLTVSPGSISASSKSTSMTAPSDTASSPVSTMKSSGTMSSSLTISQSPLSTNASSTSKRVSQSSSTPNTSFTSIQSPTRVTTSGSWVTITSSSSLTATGNSFTKVPGSSGIQSSVSMSGSSLKISSVSASPGSASQSVFSPSGNSSSYFTASTIRSNSPLSSPTATQLGNSSSTSSVPSSSQLPQSFTNSLPFVCNNTYTPQLNDTCASVATNNLISVHQLEMMNPGISCPNIGNSSSICTRDGRDGCLAFTTIGNSDTCASIAARGQIGVQALLSYNLDLDCASLSQLVNMPICLSAMPILCSPSEKGTYQVQSNQTCSTVAAMTNITVQSIIELNPLADCTTVGTGATELCILEDPTITSLGRVNYQLLSILVHAFQNQSSTLMPAYQSYMTTPTLFNVENVMGILMPLFLPLGGQDVLLGLEASNGIMSSLETAYAGRSRSDYCTLTKDAKSQSDAGIAHTCFCGSDQPFLTCIARLWNVYKASSHSSPSSSKTRRHSQGTNKARSLYRRGEPEGGEEEEDEDEDEEECKIEPNFDDLASGSMCFDASCCFPFEAFPALCWGFAAHGCQDVDDTVYRTLSASVTKDPALVEELMEEHDSIEIQVCITGTEFLEELGIKLCADIFEFDYYRWRGDMEFIGELGFFLIKLRLAGMLHHKDYTKFHQCDGACTEEKPYCYVPVGTSWFEGIQLIIDLLFFRVTIDVVAGNTPSCPSQQNPPGGIAPSPPPSGTSLGAYYGNWNIWTIGKGTFSPIPDSEVAKLDSLSYAFATVSYYYDPSQKSSAGYYIDFTDWYGDIAKQLSVPAHRAVDLGSVCTDQHGAKKIALAPYLGANGGDSCPILNCTNTQGPLAGGRTTPCQTLIDISQLPVIDGKISFSGQMIYVLDALRGKNPNMEAVISIGGWYDSNYLSWATNSYFVGGFVHSIQAFVSYFGWDGVDIDWEFPGWMHGGAPPPSMDYSSFWNTPKLTDENLDWISKNTPDDTVPIHVDMMAQYAVFLEDLGKALPSKIISIAAPAGLDKYQDSVHNSLLPNTICQTFGMPGLVINLMTYDMHGAFDGPNGVTAHQAPIEQSTWYHGSGSDYSVASAVVAWTSGGCKDIRLGIPFYGRAYLGVSPGTTCGLGQPFKGGPVDLNNEVILPSYADIISGGYSVYHDGANHGAAYALSPSGEFVSFEDEYSLSQKLNYSLNAGLGGTFYWLAGNDRNGELTQFMWTALQNHTSPILDGSQCPGSSGSSGSSDSSGSGGQPAPNSVMQSSSPANSMSPPSSVILSQSSSTTLQTAMSSATRSSVSQSTPISFPSSSSAPTATALVAQWGTCGGQGYSGPTVCAPPYNCKYQSQWYSQCL